MNFRNFIIPIVLIPLLFSCLKKNDEVEADSVSNGNLPQSVSLKIKTLSEKYFGNNPLTAKLWREEQEKAYLEIAASVFDIPAAVYIEILGMAEAEFPEDYKIQKTFILRQVSAYKKIEARKAEVPLAQFDFAKDKAKSAYPHDYVEQLKVFGKWEEVYKARQKVSDGMSADERKNFEKTSDFGLDADKTLAHLKGEIEARNKMESAELPSQISSNEAKNMREYCARKHPGNYSAQMTEYNMMLARLRSDSSLTPTSVLSINAEVHTNERLRTPESETEHKLADVAENAFRNSVFTKRGKENDIMLAVLANMKGKTVVICSRGFVDTLPVVLSNSSGKIKCSRAYVSKEFPTVILIPDEEPKNFKPMEIASPSDTADLPGRPMFAIGPRRGGIEAGMVEIFSEDMLYINLRSGYSPNVRHYTVTRVANRAGTRFMASTTEYIPFGENSLLIDPESGKLVSFALRIYSPGILEETGRTGSIIGYERSEFPDFNTIVRQFDGNTRSAKPFSSIRYARISAMESWEKFDIRVLEEQKTALRKFTDANNDFLKFFMENSFQDALKSRRLGNIAEKFRKELLEKRLSRATYERVYRNYMIDVQFAMRREMIQYPNADKFYSIYRGEMQYQINLRQAMFKYISELVKDENILNIIHPDLKTRYQSQTYEE